MNYRQKCLLTKYGGITTHTAYHTVCNVRLDAVLRLAPIDAPITREAFRSMLYHQPWSALYPCKCVLLTQLILFEDV